MATMSENERTEKIVHTQKEKEKKNTLRPVGGLEMQSGQSPLYCPQY